MTFETIMSALESKGNEQTVKVYRDHGAQGELFGVKVADLKPIQKAIKKNYVLSKQLFDSKNSDAMHLSGLIADEKNN
jgi:hypothetical protein